MVRKLQLCHAWLCSPVPGRRPTGSHHNLTHEGRTTCSVPELRMAYMQRPHPATPHRSRSWERSPQLRQQSAAVQPEAHVATHIVRLDARDRAARPPSPRHGIRPTNGPIKTSVTNAMSPHDENTSEMYILYQTVPYARTKATSPWRRQRTPQDMPRYGHGEPTWEMSPSSMQCLRGPNNRPADQSLTYQVRSGHRESNKT